MKAVTRRCSRSGFGWIAMTALLLLPGAGGYAETHTVRENSSPDGKVRLKLGGDAALNVTLKSGTARLDADSLDPIECSDRLTLTPTEGPLALDLPRSVDEAFIEDFKLVWLKPDRVAVAKELSLENAAGHKLKMKLERTFLPLSIEDVELALNLGLPRDARFIGFASHNRLTNTGDKAWSKEWGVVALQPQSAFDWLDPSVVIAPYDPNGTGSEVYGGYLGEPGSDRLMVDGDNQVILFRAASGQPRKKIGLNGSRAKEVIGAIHFRRKILMIVHYDGTRRAKYANSRPTQSEGELLEGDVLLATDPLWHAKYHTFSLSTVSPAMMLEPGQSVAHHHRTMLFTGDLKTLSTISERVLGVALADVQRQMEMTPDATK